MNFHPEMIGVGKYTGELAVSLTEQGHSVEVVTAQPHYPGFAARDWQGRGYAVSHEAGVRVWRCPLLLRKGGRGIWRLAAPLSFALAAAPVLLWRALCFRPNLVLCIEPTLLAAPAAIAAASLVGARTALHVQDLELDAAFAAQHLRRPSLRRIAELVERRLLRAFDAIITISDAMAARLARKGVPAARLTVVRNWIAATAGADEPVPCGRQWLGIGREERVILYAGHLGAKQGVASLLDALERLTSKRPVRVVIAGEGPMAPLVAGACDRIPGLMTLPLQPKGQHEALLAMADVHVLPQDPCAADLVFPSKLGLMLASGRPVVVTADAGSELFRWLGDAAVVVPAGDPDALATGLDRALDEQPGERRALALALARTLDARVLLPAFAQVLVRLHAAAANATSAAPSWTGPEGDSPAPAPELG